MSDLLDEGVSWLSATRKTGMSRTVVYTRCGATVSLAAMIGSTTAEVPDNSGGLIRVESVDFVVKTSDLVLGGNAIRPQSGDTITTQHNGKDCTYEVLDLGGGTCWRWHDPFQDSIRIHSKKIEVEQ